MDRVVAVGREKSHFGQQNESSISNVTKTVRNGGVHPENPQKNYPLWDLGKKKSKTRGYPMSVCGWTFAKSQL